jgi:hypothetical protein
LIPALFDPAKIEESTVASARALKIKILTKGLVTINGGHLMTPLGVHLLKAHPDLFDGEAILPAFREDKNSLADYIFDADFSHSKIDKGQMDEHIAKLGELIKQVMPWQLGNVGNSFRGMLVGGLRNPAAMVVRELTAKGIAAKQIQEIASDIDGLNFDEEKDLQDYLGKLPDNTRDLIKRFTTACYHMNGTSVVRCETGTDLSPLSKFKATDVLLAARDAHVDLLSDDAIFLEAFMGFALDTIQASVVPAQIVDALDFKTAHQLGAALRTQGFQMKYEEIVESLASSISNPDPQEAIDRLDEGAVANKAAELAKIFHREIKAELPGYKTAIQSDTAEEAYRVGADVGLDIAIEAVKAIPVIGSVVSFASIIKSGAKASGAASEIWSVRDQSKAFTEAQQRRNEEIQSAIGRLNTNSQKKTKLLDAVATLSDVHGLLIRRA